MNVVSGVEESTCCYRDIGDVMAVKGKFERQLHGHGSSMRLRQEFVDCEIRAVCVDALAMEIREVLVLNKRAVVVFVKIFVELSEVVLDDRLIGFLIGDVYRGPIDLGAILAAL